MNKFKLNPNYKIQGAVLGKSFEEDVYSYPDDTLDKLTRDLSYYYSEGNCGCDCNKRILADAEVSEDEDLCGDTIKYEVLNLVHKDNGVVVDLLKQPWFEND